ncbi:hypothetical protein [Accumulibacter sp.]|uniref:hypothetical protein n=1 Tax=Accumulibacter sp. TaxID=2053492 RepID=UPI00258F5FC2|nr:hypothetical protein [Accumulibacter sp.]
MNGEKFIATLVSVPQLGWTVLVAQPRGDALKPFVSTLWALAVAALVALLLVTIATLLLARRVRAAHRSLHGADARHRRGRLRAALAGFADQEFDELAADLDRMSLAIRQRERELATSEARYRSVVSNAPVVIFQFDEMGVFHFSEGKGVAGAGFEPGQAVGQSLFTLYGQYPEIRAHARRAIDGEALQFVSRIGDTYFDTHFNSVRADDGTVQVIGVAWTLPSAFAPKKRCGPVKRASVIFRRWLRTGSGNRTSSSGSPTSLTAGPCPLWQKAVLIITR